MQRFQTFFDGDAKTLFFVDNDQTQVTEIDIVASQSMCTDHDIDFAPFEIPDRFSLLGLTAKSAKLCDLDRKFRHPAAKVVIVLFGQNGGRHQHRDLISAGDRFERGPQSDFCFSESDIAANQAIHRLGQFHVYLAGIDRGNLIRRFDVGKAGIELPLPSVVWIKNDSLSCCPFGLHF